MLYQLSHIRMPADRTVVRPACVEDSNPRVATTSNRSGRASVSCMSHSAATSAPTAPGVAQFAGVRAEGVCDYADLTRTPDALDGGGWWAIAGEFAGPVHAWRFAQVAARSQCQEGAHDGGARAWQGPRPGLWSSTMDRDAYLHAVARTQEAIREGDVYQANICRVLSAPVPDRPDAGALAEVLAGGNPAPYAGYLDIPGAATTLGATDGHGSAPATSTWPGCWVVSASPELSFAVEQGMVRSGPIKGTGRTPADLGAKDRAENVMITDLVRNDLQRICAPGTVTVTDLLATEKHPGLVHLVSRVRGRLSDEPVRWGGVLRALHPPGSTSGAPKSSALQLIDELEPAARGVYCGQVGWIDADAQTAMVAVAIRTFTWAGGLLRFGTGAGITIGSDPEAEWAETELKAARLVALASS